MHDQIRFVLIYFEVFILLTEEYIFFLLCIFQGRPSEDSIIPTSYSSLPTNSHSSHDSAQPTRSQIEVRRFISEDEEIDWVVSYVTKKVKEYRRKHAISQSSSLTAGTQGGSALPSSFTDYR